jgi:hypothetical protein
MTTAVPLNRTARAIANAIVDLVERTAGPVTLARIEREIPGFASYESRGWEYFSQHAGTEFLIWYGMTKAGFAALRNVMTERRVAVQYVHPVLYIVEDCLPERENWQPIVLLPKTAANLDTPNWLVRASQGGRDYCIARAAKEGRGGYRPLTPGAVRFTAGQFAIA